MSHADELFKNSNMDLQINILDLQSIILILEDLSYGHIF